MLLNLIHLSKVNPRTPSGGFQHGIGKQLHPPTVHKTWHINLFLGLATHDLAQGGNHPLPETVTDIKSPGIRLGDYLHGVIRQ